MHSCTLDTAGCVSLEEVGNHEQQQSRHRGILTSPPLSHMGIFVTLEEHGAGGRGGWL